MTERAIDAASQQNAEHEKATPSLSHQSARYCAMRTVRFGFVWRSKLAVRNLVGVAKFLPEGTAEVCGILEPVMNAISVSCVAASLAS